MAFERLMADVDLWSGEMRSFVVDGTPILLLKLDDRVVAYEDRCCHKGIPLSAGEMRHGILTCPAHHWQYDAATGRGVNPKGLRLRSFPVRRDDGGLFVDVTGEDHDLAARG